MTVAFSASLEAHTYAYFTTTGRQSGTPHRVEIWFCVVDDVLCAISGGRDRSDWVRNLLKQPELTIEVGDASWTAQASIPPDDPDHPARGRLAGRYQGGQEGTPLTEWATHGLVLELRPAG